MRWYSARMESNLAEGPQESPRNERKESHEIWPVTFDAKGNLYGLPEGIPRERVILFLGEDNKWYAQNPSPELLEQLRWWRTDWQDMNGG